MTLHSLRQDWFSNVRNDLLAGLVVALALIPEAIAFSIIAGVDPKVGLYASFSIATLIALVGGRPGMISAATGAMALVMVTLVKSHGLDYLLAATVLERTVRELQGTPCIDLENNPPPKKEIATTRSFGRPVLELHQLAEAVTDFASRAAEKLRKQSGMANQVLVYIRTSPFRPDPQYSRSITTPLRRPSADTACFAKAALDGLQRIFQPSFKYAKAGVMLLDLQHEGQQQCELDLEGNS